MKIPTLHPLFPNWHQLIRESIIVLGGALIAAAIVGNVPALRDWIKTQWQDPNTPK